MQSPSTNSVETRAAFRIPSNPASNRNYRHRSPSRSSSSSEESPKIEHGASSFSSRDAAKFSEHQQRKNNDERELDRDSGWSQHGKDSYRHSDRYASRNSHGYGYCRHDEYSKQEKHGDNEEKCYRASSLSHRDSRGATHSDHMREESEHGIGSLRDYMRNADKHSGERYDSSGHRSKDKGRDSLSLDRRKFRDKDTSTDRGGPGEKHSLTSEEKDRDRDRRDRDGRDEKKDRTFCDHKSDRALYYEQSRGYRNDGRDHAIHCYRESYKNDRNELHSQKEKKKPDESDAKKDKDRYNRSPREPNKDKPVSGSENHEFLAKKPKLLSSGRDADYNTDVNEKQSSKQVEEVNGKVTVGQAHATNLEAANDLNAAKVAAMKAAELVNRNLVGVGFMSTEQKKKLLWGNKNSTTSEESGHRWDTALFGDRERQEKFNKLMGVKGDVKVEHGPDNEDGSGRLQAEKQKELHMDLEKQYTAGLRRRDGRTVGLGL